MLFLTKEKKTEKMIKYKGANKTSLFFFWAFSAGIISAICFVPSSSVMAASNKLFGSGEPKLSSVHINNIINTSLKNNKSIKAKDSEGIFTIKDDERSKKWLSLFTEKEANEIIAILSSEGDLTEEQIKRYFELTLKN
jgi:hypothetical protein